MYTHTAKARETGRPVTVVSAEDAGLDPGGEGDTTKWYTICEDHGWLTGHATLALAIRHSSNPLGWCEPCMWDAETYSAADGTVRPAEGRGKS